jgi:hypothetical protein
MRRESTLTFTTVVLRVLYVLHLHFAVLVRLSVTLHCLASQASQLSACATWKTHQIVLPCLHRCESMPWVLMIDVGGVDAGEAKAHILSSDAILAFLSDCMICMSM